MKRTFFASLQELPGMLTFIKDQAQGHGADSEALGRIELASEEALVNIVNYSYPELKGPIDIACENCSNERGFRVVIKDRGVPYNPLKCLRAPAYKPSSVVDPIVGGYGIFLMLQMMDEVDYKREQGTNELVLTKYY